MTDLEDALRSELAAVPEPALQVSPDLLTHLQRRQARRRLLAPATVVSIVVAALIAIPVSLGAVHRSGRHVVSPAEPGGTTTMTLTLHPLDGAALEPGTRTVVLRLLKARMRVAHISGKVQPGDSPDTLRVTGLARPLPTALLAVGALTLRQVYAFTSGDMHLAEHAASNSASFPHSPSQCTHLPDDGVDQPSAKAVCLYETVRCTTYEPNPASQIADSWSVACSRDKTLKYLLWPAAVVSSDVKAAHDVAETSGSQAGEWQVNLTFTGTGQQRFTNLTRVTVRSQAPTNQVAMVVDGVVQAAPVTQKVILGDAQIPGSHTETQANRLAAVLSTGPLPAWLN
jgi:hypothetical protein